MVSNSRRCLPRRSAVIFVLLPFLMILAFVSTVSAQLGTPVASSSPAEPTTLAPAWLEFGPDGRLIARVITQAECPAVVTEIFAALLAVALFFATDWSTPVALSVGVALVLAFSYFWLPRAIGLWVATE